MPVGVYRQLLWQRLSQLTGLDDQTLKTALPSAPEITHTPTPNPEETAVLVTRPVRRQYEVHNRRPQSIAGRSSLSDKAIQLLLQKSTAATTLDTALLLSQLPTESALLLDVIDFCQQQPDCTIIAILGTWEGTAEGAHLKALAEDATFSPALNVEGERGHFESITDRKFKPTLKETTEFAAQVQLKKELRALVTLLRKKPE